MKQLAIMRHAKSDWGDAKLDDLDRPLNDRGWKAARRIGRELDHRGFHFDLVLASPAARVRETIDGLQEKFAIAGPIRFERQMYLASESQLLQLVRELPETANRPLFVGHNPGLQHLVINLAHGGEHHLRRKVREKFPTGAVAIVDLPAGRWDEVEEGSGNLVDLILPKDLD